MTTLLLAVGGWTVLLSVLSAVVWKLTKRYFAIVGHSETRFALSENWGAGYTVIKWTGTCVKGHRLSQSAKGHWRCQTCQSELGKKNATARWGTKKQ